MPQRSPEKTAQKAPMGIPRPLVTMTVRMIKMTAATKVVYLSAPAGFPP